MRRLSITLVFIVCLLSRAFAQSDWQGTWSNYDLKNHTHILQVKVRGKDFLGTWYCNDNWHLYKVEFKGELSKKGKKVTGTYRYTDNSETGIFELKIDEFSERAPQYAAGCKLFFEGHLGVNKINFRSWNGSKRSDDTSVKLLREFVETFKKERPKAYTSDELIELVHKADFLHEYRNMPVDTSVRAIKTCQLYCYCKDGNFSVKGVNPYILGDFYFFKNGTVSECAIYISVADAIVAGSLDRTDIDAMGNQELTYTLNGRIGNAVITKMILKRGKATIYFSEYDADKKLNCSFEN